MDDFENKNLSKSNLPEEETAAAAPDNADERPSSFEDGLVTELEGIRDLLQTELDKAEAILDELVARQSCFSLRDLAVRGSDLTALGLHGPAVGETLQRLLDAVMDGEAPNEKESLLRLVTSDLRHEP